MTKDEASPSGLSGLSGTGEPAHRTRLLLNLGRMAIWLGGAALVAGIFAPPDLRLPAVAAGATAIIAGVIIACRYAEMMIPEIPEKGGAKPERPLPSGPVPGKQRRRRNRRQE